MTVRVRIRPAGAARGKLTCGKCRTPTCSREDTKRFDVPLEAERVLRVKTYRCSRCRTVYRTREVVDGETSRAFVR